MAFDIRQDDLSGEPSRALLAIHLAGMHADSPPGHVFALDLSGLLAKGMTVWSVWQDGEIAAIGALKEWDGGIIEVKSMRTHPAHLRQGAATALLRHMIAEAEKRGMQRLSLETGSGPAFEPAILLYRRHGFVDGEAFGCYQRSAFNQFLHRDLDSTKAGGAVPAPPRPPVIY